MTHRYRTAVLLCVLFGSLAPASADAQFRRGRAVQGEISAWAPITVGVHAGYDDASRAELIGAQAGIPLIRNGRIEFMPSYDLTFLNRAKDHQYGLEAIYVSGGRAGGLYVGGGVGWRDTVIDSTPTEPRHTKFGYSAVVGFKSAPGGLISTQLQLRWIFLQDTVADFRPVPFTLGLNFPLWGRPPSGS